MGQTFDFAAAAVLVKVVEAGSFRGAARALGMPKSSVSRRVAELEARLGVRLLQRTTRRVGLTDAGKVYFDRASAGITTLEEAEDAAREAAAAGLGIARVPALLAERAIAERRLVSLLDAHAPPAVPLHALYPSARYLSPKVRVFVEMLRARVGSGVKASL
jgi:DNA-binding transcriptional LysR family regulator